MRFPWEFFSRKSKYGLFQMCVLVLTAAFLELGLGTGQEDVRIWSRMPENNEAQMIFLLAL